MVDSFSVAEVGDGTAIIGMDTAGTLSAVAWTGPELRAESLHKGIKERFR